MSIRVLTPPSIEPVTLSEARLWCRIDDDDTTQDAMLLILIGAMREYAEEITGRAIAARQLEVVLDRLPDGSTPIELPSPPLQSVSYIRYLDTGGVEQEMSGSPTQWIIDNASLPGRISPLFGANWPGTNDGIGNVRIGFTCGYPNVTAMPKKLRLWMQTRIATLNEHREQIDMSNLAKLPYDFVDGLLDGLRVLKMFA